MYSNAGGFIHSQTCCSNDVVEIDWLPLIAQFIGFSGITILIGILNSWEILSKPLEILRKEV